MNWWEDGREVVRVEAMLKRAHMLPDSEVEYFRSKPWKWTGERNIADRLEGVMGECGVPAEDGWSMTAEDVLRHLQRSQETASDRRVRLARQVPTMSRPFARSDNDDEAEMDRDFGPRRS